MTKRSFLAGLLGFIGVGSVEATPPTDLGFPPVPAWHPSFAQPIEHVVDRLSYYTDGKRDFVVFRNGTCVVLEEGISDAAAEAFARKVLADILSYHPDMNPSPMDDGNILVRYNHPAVNVVIREVVLDHQKEVEDRHLDGLTEAEVLMTPLGPNKFDDFGKQALLGRAYMFMDAQNPEIVRIHRHQ
ncbi:hypothetical protein [Novosphingobium sp. ST904]|uniref:hypothetical protein n=2 Tax=Novosphingobium sp. ST904 TaxID=1684385 RepID=UPI001A9F9748|nr:hypothetical protein [Novosphingobium sp. ST904]